MMRDCDEKYFAHLDALAIPVRPTWSAPSLASSRSSA